MSQIEIFGSYTKDDAAKARAEEATAGWLKLKPGTNVVRIMPPLVGMLEPWVTAYQHFIKIPGAKQVIFNCPRRCENARCPACEKGDRLKATGNKADEIAAKEFWPSQRNFGFAIDRDAMDLGIQIFGFGATIKARLRHFREKLGKDFTDLANGFDIVIEKVGEGMKTEYQADLGEQGPAMADMSKLAALASDLPDLKSFAKVLSYDQIIEKFASSAGAAAGNPAIAQGQQPRAVRSASVQDDMSDVDNTSDPY